MASGGRRCIALLYPGDRAARDRADPAASRFAPLFQALQAAGVAAEPAVYDDDFVDEVEAQLCGLRGVLVWHNPVENGRTRAALDAMLRRVASRGVPVSAHPDTIVKLGTKDLLVDVRDLPFGTDTHRVDTLAQLRTDVVGRLARGPRVLKQHRGHSGIGVWRVEQLGAGRYAMRHAQRGCDTAQGTLDQLCERLAPFFADGGHMVDQAWQPRLAEGMVRAYLSGSRVAGFGHQAVNALFPAAPGEAPPAPGPRLYSDADDPRFQRLRRLLDDSWVSLLARHLGLPPERLPVLWDADFLLGEADAAGEDRYVLCEVNVSSVAPYPASADAAIVAAVQGWLRD